MGVVAEKTLMTPDDLLVLPDEKNYELSGEDVVPGFTCSVGSIFPPKAPTPAVEIAPKA